MLRLLILHTEEDFSKIVEPTVESLIRLLSDFKKEKLIDFKGKKIQCAKTKKPG